MSTPARPPSTHQRAWHNTVTMTAIHARRIKAGVLESSPSDYLSNHRYRPSQDDLRIAQARKRLEDMKMVRELGLEWREGLL